MEKVWMDGYPMRPSLSHSFPFFVRMCHMRANGWIYVCVLLLLLLGWLRIPDERSLRGKEGRRIYSAIDQYFMFFEPLASLFGAAGPFSMLSYVMCTPSGRKFRGREKKGREGKEGEKLFETGKWRLLPTPTALWSFCFPSELGTGEDGTADLNTWKGKPI